MFSTCSPTVTGINEPSNISKKESIRFIFLARGGPIAGNTERSLSHSLLMKSNGCNSNDGSVPVRLHIDIANLK